MTNSGTEGDADRSRIRLLPSAGLLLAVVVLAGVVYFASLIRQSEPDYYQPARAALVAAQKRLADSYQHETALIEQLQISHRDLDAAINELQKAARKAPGNQQRIEDLRVRLHALADPDWLAKADTKQMQQSFRELSDEIDALIVELQHAGSETPQQ
jgi:septal ring factor EnvC (AmiA/AmiB activator)